MDNNLWKEFNAENYDREVIEDETGFILYKRYSDNSMYIHVAFIKKEYRRNGSVGRLESKLIEKCKPTDIFCYVDLTSNNPHKSLAAIIKNGYKIESTTTDRIMLHKKV